MACRRYHNVPTGVLTKGHGRSESLGEAAALGLREDKDSREGGQGDVCWEGEEGEGS